MRGMAGATMVWLTAASSIPSISPTNTVLTLAAGASPAGPPARTAPFTISIPPISFPRPSMNRVAGTAPGQIRAPRGSGGPFVRPFARFAPAAELLSRRAIWMP
jgi:hypothetical protein